MIHARIKVAIWKDIFLNEGTNVNEVIDNAESCNISELYAEGNSEHFHLESERILTPEENDGLATFQIFDNEIQVWANGIVP